MRKYSWAVTLILAFSSVSLMGCSIVPDLTEQEQGLIAEYAAGTLLQHSEKYDRRLVTEVSADGEEAQPTAEATVTPSASPSPAPTDTDQGTSPVQAATQAAVSDGTTGGSESVSLKELYNISGVTFSYKKSEFCKSYPKKPSAGLSATKAAKGETLYVVTFSVKNNSGKKKKISLAERNLDYTLKVDGNEFKPGVTILENMGLNYLNTTLASGRSEEAALVFSMSAERKNAATITLVITDEKNNKTTEVTIQ